jgi:hypothetical protein
VARGLAGVWMSALGAQRGPLSARPARLQGYLFSLSNAQGNSPRDAKRCGPARDPRISDRHTTAGTT